MSRRQLVCECPPTAWYFSQPSYFRYKSREITRIVVAATSFNATHKAMLPIRSAPLTTGHFVTECGSDGPIRWSPEVLAENQTLDPI
jgi:hypothetical protein